MNKERRQGGVPGRRRSSADAAWDAELQTVREAGRQAGLTSPATTESIARLSLAMGVPLRFVSQVTAKGA